MEKIEIIDWLYNYGEQRGLGHIKNGLPCQDKTFCLKQNGVSVVVLSDGCSSGVNSEYGADITTKVLCNQFVENFDKLYSSDDLLVRKVIVQSIVKGMKKFTTDNISSDIFDKYKAIPDNKKIYEKIKGTPSEIPFLISSLDATALFVAVKDDKFIIGQIGDGFIGAVEDNKLSILMDEKKIGSANATCYPWNVFQLSKSTKDKSYYDNFRFLRTNKLNFDGFILISDGCDAMIDSSILQLKSFRNYPKKMLRNTSINSFEKARQVLLEDSLPQLIKLSSAKDDCSVAILVKKSYEKIISDIVSIPKHFQEESYFIQKINKLEGLNNPSEDSYLEGTKKENNDIKEGVLTANHRGGDENALFEGSDDMIDAKKNLLDLISSEELSDFIAEITQSLGNDDDKVNEIFSTYYDLLKDISLKGEYEISEGILDKANIYYIYSADSKITKTDGKLFRGFINDK